MMCRGFTFRLLVIGIRLSGVYKSGWVKRPATDPPCAVFIETNVWTDMGQMCRDRPDR